LTSDFDSFYLDYKVLNNLKKYWEDCPDWLQYEILSDAKFKIFVEFLEHAKLHSKGISKQFLLSKIEEAKKDVNIIYPGAPYLDSNDELISAKKAGNDARIMGSWQNQFKLTWRLPQRGNQALTEMGFNEFKSILEHIKNNWSELEYLVLILAVIKRSITTSFHLDGRQIMGGAKKFRTNWLVGMYNDCNLEPAISTDRAVVKFRSQNWGGLKTGGCSMSNAWVVLWEYLALVYINNWEFRFPKKAHMGGGVFKLPTIIPKSGGISPHSKPLYKILDEPKIYVTNTNKDLAVLPTYNLNWLYDIIPTQNPSGSRRSTIKNTIKLIPNYNLSIMATSNSASFPQKIHIPLFFISDVPPKGKLYLNWIDNPLSKAIESMRLEKINLQKKEQNNKLLSIEKAQINKEVYEKYRNSLNTTLKSNHDSILTELNNRDVDSGGLYLNRGLLHNMYEFILKDIQNSEKDKNMQFNVIDIITVLMVMSPKQPASTESRALYKSISKWFKENSEYEKPKRAVGSLKYHESIKDFYNYLGDLTPFLTLNQKSDSYRFNVWWDSPEGRIYLFPSYSTDSKATMGFPDILFNTYNKV
jgi:hypothetical protein